MENVPYRSLTGSLLYASLLARPDVAYATHAVCRFNADPGRSHWNAAKRILKYLISTRTHGIVYSGKTSALPVTYSDSDWGDNKDNRRSQTGWTVSMAGGLVNWSSKAQKSVALSSCEAEYMAGAECCREILWLKQLLQEMKVLDPQQVLVVNMDSTSAIALAHNPISHQRTKHIDIKYHFIRDLVLADQIKLVYVPTADKIADLFTKAVSKLIFQRLVTYLVRA